MYNCFKTDISIHHPLEYITQPYQFLRHPISSGRYENKICPLGKMVSILLAIWILFREKKEKVRINKGIFWALLLGTLLMNLNAFVYLIPIFIYELYFLS